ncbi:MAG TPA: hypothetical protein VFS71_09960 [Flavobacterium sp.]|uniref:hypothetical protein n=1 Tax=Flavobacterium sp. TaxID=239 RepID=UPI002DBF7D6B|nr:hypothetical protein [Flavobacterium sp.]HEU4789999.1 hypothetical protein [Flavobacterium sp.]
MKKEFKYIIIISLLFIATSIGAINQILLLTFNGSILHDINGIFFSGAYTKVYITNWIINAGLSVIFILAYYYSKNKIAQIIYPIFFLIFCFCLICFMLVLDKVEDPNPYYLYALISSVISALILNAFAIIKFRNK